MTTRYNRFLIALSGLLCLGLTACSDDAVQVTTADMLKTYADIASAAYSDSLTRAQALQAAVDTLVATPTDANLTAAKAAYKAARLPYSQTEVFRFDESFVSSDVAGIASIDSWESQVNAWPLDEALIDYVDTDSYEGTYTSSDNIINSNSVSVGGTAIDTSTLTTETLASLNELGGSEVNVATGYHAIEFLLWGQDVNGNSPGAGNRPVSDYQADGACTSGASNPQADAICAKRGLYLKTVAALLVEDLTSMVAEWNPASTGKTLRKDLLTQTSTASLRRVLFGMGSLSLGELASERMQVALLTGSTEDEHDCFSDTTHNSYFYNAKGVQNIYLGRYTRIDGSVVSGVGISQLVAAKNATQDTQVKTHLTAVQTAMQAIVNSAENDGVAFDQLIATNAQGGTAERRALISTAVQALVDSTTLIEQAAQTLGISSLNSDSGSQF